MLDTQAKRMAAVGVARPWLRRVYPDGSKGSLWRSSVGNAVAFTEMASAYGDILIITNERLRVHGMVGETLRVHTPTGERLFVSPL